MYLASSFTETANKFGAVIAVLTLIVTALVYLWSTAKRGRQDIIRQDNVDLRASNQEMRTEKAAFEATIKQQANTIDRLRDIATQTPAVTRLIDMNNRQQKQTNLQHREVLGGLSNLTAELSHLVTAINEREGHRGRKA